MIHVPYIRIDFPNFFHVGLCFVLKRLQVTSCHEEHPIRVINEDC